MELTTINSTTTWQAASDGINKNNAKINEAVMRLENATYKNKGYFKSVEQLQTAIPNPSSGSKAYVGTNYPYAIYTVEDGAWVDSGETGGDESLDLTQYYTIEEAKAMFVSSTTVRGINTEYTQEQLDQMEEGELDSNILYLALEEV